MKRKVLNKSRHHRKPLGRGSEMVSKMGTPAPLGRWCSLTHITYVGLVVDDEECPTASLIKDQGMDRNDDEGRGYGGSWL